MRKNVLSNFTFWLPVFVIICFVCLFLLTNTLYLQIYKLIPYLIKNTLNWSSYLKKLTIKKKIEAKNLYFYIRNIFLTLEEKKKIFLLNYHFLENIIWVFIIWFVFDRSLSKIHPLLEGERQGEQIYRALVFIIKKVK